MLNTTCNNVYDYIIYIIYYLLFIIFYIIYKVIANYLRRNNKHNFTGIGLHISQLVEYR